MIFLGIISTLSTLSVSDNCNVLAYLPRESPHDSPLTRTSHKFFLYELSERHQSYQSSYIWFRFCKWIQWRLTPILILFSEKIGNGWFCHYFYSLNKTFRLSSRLVSKLYVSPTHDRQETTETDSKICWVLGPVLLRHSFLRQPNPKIFESIIYGLFATYYSTIGGASRCFWRVHDEHSLVAESCTQLISVINNNICVYVHTKI